MRLRLSEEEFAALKEKRAPKEAKRPKYGNVKKEFNGLTFDSTKELRRYQDLLAQQAAAQITELERQRPFAVEINGKHIGWYFSDFCFKRDGKLIVEDVKSKATKTDLYRWKKKCVEALYDVVITEIL